MNSEGINMTEIIEGTQPHAHVEHEPRVLARGTDDDLMMMTEIGDGVFVQWGNCRNCNERVYKCECEGGPVEPPYMKKWRDERFLKELNERPEPEYTLLPSVIEWLTERGYTVAKSIETQLAEAEPFDPETAPIPNLTDKERDDLMEALEDESA